MKISELIDKLREIQDKEGDLTVIVQDYENLPAEPRFYVQKSKYTEPFFDENWNETGSISKGERYLDLY